MHPIYTLESLMRMGIVERTLEPDDDIMIRYDFVIPVDSYFKKTDLQNLQDLFQANKVEISYYYDYEEEKDRVVVEVCYETDLLQVCDSTKEGTSHG